MNDSPDPDRLEVLDARIKAARKAPTRTPKTGKKYTAASQAWQMVIELTVGMVIGVAIGLGLDSVTGMQPLFVVIFTLLGFGAGVRVMMQTAQTFQKKNEAQALKEKSDGQDVD